MTVSEILGYVSSNLDQMGISPFIQAALVILLTILFFSWLISKVR